MPTYKISQPNSGEATIYVYSEQPGVLESLEAASVTYGDGLAYVQVEIVKDANEIAQAERYGVLANVGDADGWFWEGRTANPFGFPLWETK